MTYRRRSGPSRLLVLSYEMQWYNIKINPTWLNDYPTSCMKLRQMSSCEMAIWASGFCHDLSWGQKKRYGWSNRVQQIRIDDIQRVKWLTRAELRNPSLLVTRLTSLSTGKSSTRTASLDASDWRFCDSSPRLLRIGPGNHEADVVRPWLLCPRPEMSVTSWTSS